MKRTAILGFLAVLLHSGSTHAADGPRLFAPSSGWTLDFADERCSLIREFADGDESLRLQIDSYGTRHGFRVMVSGDAVPSGFNVPITEVRVGYSPDTRERPQFFATTGMMDDTTAASFLDGFVPDPRTLDPALSAEQPTPEQARELDRIIGEFERQVTHLTVQFGLRKPLRLETGSMAAPFAAMQKCVDDLIASWGFDPATHWARQSPPVPTPETVEALQRKYPQRPARDRIGAFVPVRVSVDETGKATDCVVQIATVDEVYKQSICEGLSGAYAPARDAEGNPIAGVLQIPSIWRLGA